MKIAGRSTFQSMTCLSKRVYLACTPRGPIFLSTNPIWLCSFVAVIAPLLPMLVQNGRNSMVPLDKGIFRLGRDFWPPAMASVVQNPGLSDRMDLSTVVYSAEDRHRHGNLEEHQSYHRREIVPRDVSLFLIRSFSHRTRR